MLPVSGRTADTIAMCQHPGGPNEHVPVAPGETIDSCFAECDCTPRIYVALDAVVAALRGMCNPTGGPECSLSYAADHIEGRFGGADHA